MLGKFPEKKGKPDSRKNRWAYLQVPRREKVTIGHGYYFVWKKIRGGGNLKKDPCGARRGIKH